MKTIQYGIDVDTNLILSRVGSEVAILVLDYENMTPQNSFEPTYNLEKFSVYESLPHMVIKWTRKIDKSIKNIHREFWGMKKLK